MLCYASLTTLLHPDQQSLIGLYFCSLEANFDKHSDECAEDKLSFSTTLVGTFTP